MSDNRIIKIVNARLLRDHELVENSYLWIRNGKIINAFDSFFNELKEPDEIIDAKGAIISPGFIDLQINGAFGIDFSDYEGSDEKLSKDIEIVAKGLLQNGCTAFCPTVVTSAPEVYSKVLPLLNHRPGDAEKGAAILGAHCEGPFISTEKKGAHDQAVIQDAKNGIASLDTAYGPELKNGGETVRIMTVAPEIEGMLDTIPELIKRNITVSIGHSAATIDQAESGVAAGATFMTHLFNAMKPFHQRDPGMVGILGAVHLPQPSQPERHPLPSTTSPDKTKPDPRPFYGIICDGVHVHPNSVRIAYYAHPRGCVLVTDALSAAGLPRGIYQLGGRDVEVRGVSGAYVKGTDTLAGSTITIDHCVRNFMKFTRCTVVEALEAATLHPAQTLGIQKEKGTLNAGADADLVFLDDNLHVKRVFVGGKEVKLTKKVQDDE
ncbi:carbohydrate esterase family 9 protein [Backusella circina FSU 941]|nr:carbohydrate esterase family 9 protein [Backusella circina FSU 941]